MPKNSLCTGYSNVEFNMANRRMGLAIKQHIELAELWGRWFPSEAKESLKDAYEKIDEAYRNVITEEAKFLVELEGEERSNNKKWTKEHVVAINVDQDKDNLREKLEETSKSATKLHENISSVPKVFLPIQAKESKEIDLVNIAALANDRSANEELAKIEFCKDLINEFNKRGGEWLAPHLKVSEISINTCKSVLILEF